MKRSDHVSLTSSSSSNNGKKLRKRRELDAMAVSHGVIPVRGRSNLVRKKSNLLNGAGDNFFGSNSSSDDEFDETENSAEIRHHDGEAYMNLMRQNASSTIRNRDWIKRHRKFLTFCHKFCFVFVILSGFLVLLTLAWLHFSLRAHVQDLSAQLHQGEFLNCRNIQLLGICCYVSFLNYMAYLKAKIHKNLEKKKSLRSKC